MKHIGYALLLMTSIALPVWAEEMPMDTSTLEGPITPDIQQQGDVRFITGGIGDEEKAALEAIKTEFNLHLINTDIGGAYVGDVTLKIRNSRGEVMVECPNAGPLFYASLPAGRYTLDASQGTMQRTQTFTLTAHKATRLAIRW